MSAASLSNVREHLTNKIACLNNNNSFLNTTTITQITRYAAWYAPHIDYKAALEAGATISDMRHRDVPHLAHLIIIYLSVEAEGFVLSNGKYLCHLTIQILEDTQCCCIMIYTEPAPIEPLDLPANYIQIWRAAVAAAIFRRYVLNWWRHLVILSALQPVTRPSLNPPTVVGALPANPA
ncbi:hypothetical protein BDN71DRAFT_1432865 [Pleurotus eryngii]|uniref:Uncharacterized protein n=1 Tax=Pleurotus eryngii TaxID=5323 RepID=A0A9P6DE85_PLEER|nr:hypothetical protein BDN71DRAFT_1432865 [Pleurotus eryngii]